MARKHPTRLSVVTNLAAPVLVHVVATRADAVTLAPVFAEIERRKVFCQAIVSSNTRAGSTLTDDVLAEHGLPEPSRAPAQVPAGAGETADALVAAEAALAELSPAVVIVSGASDTALGWALGSTKRHVPVARVEAGLRDHDWSGPEEVNRVLLDTMADTLFSPTREAAANLAREGVDGGRVRVVGSTAIDSLRHLKRRARARAAWRDRGLEHGSYVLVSLHPALGFDDDERVARIAEELAALAARVPVVFPLDPQGMARLRAMGDDRRLLAAGVDCGPPVSYLDSVSLQLGAGAVVTDSGTMQDETTALGIPCFTLRGSTERVVTLTHGTNVLLGHDPRNLADVRLADGEPTPCAISMWDGRAARRIAQSLEANYAVVRVPRAS